MIKGEYMPSKTVHIPAISCGHCVRTIESEVSGLDHIEKVHADEQTRMVEISWQEPQNWQTIKALLAEINYPVDEED